MEKFPTYTEIYREVARVLLAGPITEDDLVRELTCAFEQGVESVNFPGIAAEISDGMYILKGVYESVDGGYFAESPLNSGILANAGTCSNRK